MFSLISNSPLSDVLAPRLTSLEEFIFQWNSFTSFFRQDANQNKNLCKCRIETTNLSSRLSTLCDILVEEQANFKSQPEKICPEVMEFALQNRIFETLSALAQADTPLGICPRIMLFFNRILEECKAEIIPHKCVYSSLNKLVLICGKTPAGPYEAIEILFLTCLTERLYRNPPYLNFFLTECFPLLNSLLALLGSPDSDISKRAGNAIIILISLHNEDAAKIICSSTAFCSKIISQIITHYSEIPRSLNPQEVETAISTFRNDSACYSSYTNSVRKFLCFLKWYIFFDMLIYHSEEKSILSATLMSQFKLEFLESCILPDIFGAGFREELDASENAMKVDNIFLTTVLLSNCLRNTESLALLNFISEFLVIPDKINNNIPDRHKNHHLSETLLKRCCLSQMHIKDDTHRGMIIKLASATLQLFEDILLRPSQNVIHYLLLQYLKKGQYLDVEQKHEIEIPQDQKSKYPDSTLVADIEKVAQEISSQLPNIATAPNWTSDRLSLVLHFYESLLPSELKFNSENEVDHLTYLTEAIKGEQIFLTSCYAHWQINPVDNLSHRIAELNVSSEIFDEGPFLKMIFDNLNSILSLPYDINLQMFSLLAKISLIPDEGINEYLLDPTSPVKATCRSLFGILLKIVEELQICVKGINDLRQRLHCCKKALLHEEPNESEPQHAHNDQIENILQTLIILDEFCKELTSIIFAKNQIISCSKRNILQGDFIAQR